MFDQGTCTDLHFNDVVKSGCTRTASEQRARFTAVTSVTITGFGLLGVAAICVVAGMLAHRAVGFLGLAMGAMATLCVISGVAYFVYLMESWVYCDQNFCQFVGTPGCSSALGYSYFLVAAAAFCGLLSCVSQAVGLILTSPANGVAAAGVVHDASSRQAEPHHEPAGETTAPDSGVRIAVVSPPADGDWQLDEPSGLYWSEREYLYLDVTNGHYYDPQTQMWYDPSAQEWYSKPPS